LRQLEVQNFSHDFIDAASGLAARARAIAQQGNRLRLPGNASRLNFLNVHALVFNAAHNGSPFRSTWIKVNERGSHESNDLF
jgi:hypothetical protein